MNTYNKPYLQPYNGKSTRYDCPSCKAKKTFTLYLDGNTNQPIHATVGRCERESNCGYHYTPKQYFHDNPMNKSERKEWKPLPTPTPKPVEPVRPIGLIPFDLVEKSASYASDFVRFLCDIFEVEQIVESFENYALGATKTKEVIFWQIDIEGKVRTGKIMQYDAITGKRIHNGGGAIDWVHNKLKNLGTLPQDFNLQQCFFGEHLLTMNPTATVAIVESCKSAVIASIIMPNFVWLSAGNLNGLSIDKCKVLQGRNVVLYPDLSKNKIAFDKWSDRATEIQKLYNCKISVSTLLECNATDVQRVAGLDVADFIINELSNKTTEEEIQQRFSPKLEHLIEQNSALLLLIEKFGLVETC